MEVNRGVPVKLGIFDVILNTGWRTREIILYVKGSIRRKPKLAQERLGRMDGKVKVSLERQPRSTDILGGVGVDRLEKGVV